MNDETEREPVTGGYQPPKDEGGDDEGDIPQDDSNIVDEDESGDEE